MKKFREKASRRRRSLKGENLISIDAFGIVENESPAHGQVDAVMTAMRRLDF